MTQTADPAAVRLRAATPADIGWIVAEHGRLYARDEGFDASFPALVREVATRFFTGQDAAREQGLMAETAEGRRLGCIFCCREDEATARLRLFLLLPRARGRGLGQRLHDACLSFAREAGYAHMVLGTHQSHRAALALYRRNGWQVLWEKPVRSFGRDLVEMALGREL